MYRAHYWVHFQVPDTAAVVWKFTHRWAFKSQPKLATEVGKCSELILVDPEGVEEHKCWGKVYLVKTYQGKSKVLHGKSKWNWACSWRPAPLSRACQASRRRVWSLQVLHGSLSGLEVDPLLHMLAGPMQGLWRYGLEFAIQGLRSAVLCLAGPKKALTIRFRIMAWFLLPAE